jgi:hypothetical protein
MNFYRDFCRERMGEIEEALIDASECFEVDDDEMIDAQQVLFHLARLGANANLAISTLGIMAAAKVYKIGQTCQIIEASEREDFRSDVTGLAQSITQGEDGSFAIFNPTPIGVGRAYSNPACPKIISAVPIVSVCRLGLPGLFNGCLNRHSKGHLFSCRTNGSPSSTFLYDPAADFLFADPKELSMPTDVPGAWIEDVRLFEHQENVMASGNLVARSGQGWLCRTILGEIDQAKKFAWAHTIASPTGAMVEKNWVFFSCDGGLFCVYYPLPHVVYEVELSNGPPKLGERWEAENWRTAGLMENARGGSPPVRVGDEFYHFYHTQHRHGRGVAYQVGLYTFSAAPPWNLKRIIKGPLLSMVPSNQEMDCIFPMGSFLHKEKWHLSCGVQDRETVAITLNYHDVERILTAV